MNWDQYHSRSEQLAVEAELAARAGNRSLAEEICTARRPSPKQKLSTMSLSEKRRTQGITAVSAVARGQGPRIGGGEVLRLNNILGRPTFRTLRRHNYENFSPSSGQPSLLN